MNRMHLLDGEKLIEKNGIYGGFFLIILVMAYALILHPAWLRYEQLVQEEGALRTRFKEEYRLTASLSNFQQQVGGLIKRLDRFKKKAFKNDLASVLAFLTETGVQAGLSFELVEPDKEIALENLFEQVIHLKAWGEYAPFIQFIHRIAQRSPYLRWQDFEMKEKGDLLELNMTLTWYRVSL